MDVYAEKAPQLLAGDAGAEEIRARSERTFLNFISRFAARRNVAAGYWGRNGTSLVGDDERKFRQMIAPFEQIMKSRRLAYSFRMSNPRPGMSGWVALGVAADIDYQYCISLSQYRQPV